MSDAAEVPRPTPLTIIDAIEDPALFAGAMARGADWSAWKTFLRVLFGLPLSGAEVPLFTQCTGRTDRITHPFTEAAVVVGRRGRKSFILATVGTFLAVFVNYSRWLAPNERGTVMIIAPDRRQTRTIFRFIRGLLAAPMLAGLVERETAESIDLANGVTIEVTTASFKSVRGYAVCAALVDECAMLPTDDSAEPDYALLDALRPAMASIPTGMLIYASSPYARRGCLYDAFTRHWGHDGAETLVWQADTRTMNPAVRQSVIDAAYARDPVSAAAEYGAQFRDDISQWLSRETIVAAVIPGRGDLPRQAGVAYRAFCDPSGGSSDSMTVAIGRIDPRDDVRAIVAAVREWTAPFDPNSVTQDAAELLKSYGINSVTGDHYAGEWPRARFAAHGIDYRTSERSKSEIYLEAVPLFTSRRAELPDNPKLVNQLAALERKTSRAGRDVLDHPRAGHDDVANVACGLLVGLLSVSAADAMADYPRLMASVAARAEVDIDDPDAAPPANSKPWRAGAAAATPAPPRDRSVLELFNELQAIARAARSGWPQAQKVPTCAWCRKPIAGSHQSDGCLAWCGRTCESAWSAARLVRQQALAPPVQGAVVNPRASTRFV
jgi:hypothetical protein